MGWCFPANDPNGRYHQTFIPLTPEPVPSLPKEQNEELTPRQKAFAEVKDMTLPELTELYLEVDRLCKENEKLKNQNEVHCKKEQEHLIEVGHLHSVMVAAAEEIQEHWQAHCDQDGYGPRNLMHRLENGIASNYSGYKFGAFTKLQKENEELKAVLRDVAYVLAESGEWVRQTKDVASVDTGKRITESLTDIARLLRP